MTEATTHTTNPLVRVLRRLYRNRLFLFVTVIPTLLSVIYFGFIASDVYVSEARFVVRSPERQVASPLGLILKGAGFSRAQDDSFTVQDYMLSRDALKALDEQFKLGEAFRDTRVDAFNRFAFFDRDPSFENLHRYYQKMVSVQIDSASSITTLVTRAYTAEDAYVMNRRLIELAEELINKLNDRGREDMVRFAAQDVGEAEKKAKAAALAVAQYRNAKGVIDPEKQSTVPMQHIAKLQQDLIEAKVQTAQLERVAGQNPQLPLLRQRVRILEDAIRTENAAVAGAGEKSLAGKAAEFQRLSLEREFAEKMLASAMSSLEQARSDAQRKQLYLERIAQPSKPDAALEPRRLKSILVTFIVSLIVWGILGLLAAGVREHYE